MIKCANCNTEVPAGQFCPECGTLCPAVDKEETRSPCDGMTPSNQLIGKYRIEQVLQTGDVNQYRGSIGDQPILIKEKVVVAPPLEEENGSPQPGAERPPPKQSIEINPCLKDESELLTSLQSDVFPKALDYFMENGKEYLILEYPAGERLSELLSGKKFDDNTSVGLAIELCQAVGRLHQKGYAHLDIDPNNIFFQENKRRLLTSTRSRKLGTQCHDCLTSDGYSAPELYKGADVLADSRSDIYSIGAVLYAMITGRVSPAGGSLPDVLSNIPQPELARILLSCLAANPELRYKTTDDLQQRLVAYQARPKHNLRFDTAILSDIGMVRRNNEDCGLAFDAVVWRESQAESLGLYVVADGMGGEQAGEVASNKAIAEIWRMVSESLNATAPADCNGLVRAAIEKANKEIYLLARDNPTLSSMGTTVTLGLRRGKDLYLGHVGDSRAYLIRDGNIQQLTEDHSLVAGLIKAGIITPAEAKTHPDRSKIFRSLGNSPNVFIDSYREEKLTLQAGDGLLFCTDGLVNNVSDDQLLAELTKASTTHATCAQLVTLANKAGGDDNVTVIVVKTSLLT